MSFQNIILIEGKDNLKKTDTIKKLVTEFLKDDYEKISIFCDKNKINHYKNLSDYCSITELYGNDDDHEIIEDVLINKINRQDENMELLIFDTLSLSKPFVRFTNGKRYSSFSKEINDKISIIITINDSHDLYEYTDISKDLGAYFHIGSKKLFYSSRCNCNFIDVDDLDLSDESNDILYENRMIYLKKITIQ